MKVLHLVAGNLNEGAAKGAYILHKNLLSSGVQSTILTNSFIHEDYEKTKSISDRLSGRLASQLRMKVDNSYKLFYKDQPDIKFSPGLTGYKFVKNELYRQADIIHLHWVCNGFVDIKHLAQIKKPIVWTLRDMWPMTGGCHYSLECERFIDSCGCCPHLSSTRQSDLSTYLQIRKKKYYPEHITFVGISEWISEQAKKSRLLSDFKVKTISNNIDLKSFSPVDSSMAKHHFSLPDDKFVLLFGAQYLNSLYKGYDILIEIIDKLDSDIELVFFGRRNPVELKRIRQDIRYLGFLKSSELRKAYSAADVFVSPSRMEAFGKTVAESMACGTPVVCFAKTGSADIVDHKINGYLADPYLADSMIKGIRYLLRAENKKSFKEKAIKKVQKNYSSDTIAQKYLQLYKESILKNEKR